MTSTTIRPDAVTQRYLSERESLVGRIDTIKQTSLDEDRDLTDQDQSALRNYHARIQELDGLINLAATGYELEESVAQRIATMGAQQYAPVKYRTAGEVLWDTLHQGDQDARRRYQQVTKRAAEHMGTDAALTTPVAGDLGGLVVSAVSGPIIDLKPGTRPFLSALGVQTAPQAFSFQRPRLIDDHLQDDYTQALQKGELASHAFNVKADTVDLQTVGNYLNISQQLLSLQPGSLNIILGQLMKRLAYATEVLAISKVTATTNEIAGVDMTDGAAVRGAIYDASAEVYAQTGALPEWIAMGPQGWAALGSLVDLANRPLFPVTNPVNADGSMSPGSFEIVGLGLRGVVTPAITDGSFYVGNSVGLEAYEYRYPVLEAVEPSVLGRQIAVASSLAFYQPPTTEAGDGGDPPAAYGAIVKIPAA